MNEALLHQIDELMTEIFGSTPQHKISFAKWLNDPTFSVKTKFVDNKLVAICCVYYIEKIIPDKYAAFGEQALSFLQTGERLGGYLTLAVKADYRQRQIGKALAYEQLAWLKDKGCEKLFGISWIHGGGDSSESLFRSAGFELIGESLDFYRNESQLVSHSCSRCKGVCQCKAYLFGRLI